MMVERIEVNLLPAEYRVHKSGFRLKREIIYPLLGILILGFILFSWTIGIEARIGLLHSDINSLDNQISANRPVQNEINRLRNDRTAIQEKIMALERISVNREKWVRLMEELSSRLPDYTWLVSIKEEPVTPPVLHLEGRTFSFPDVANYMSSLKESEYVSSVDLSNIEQIDSKDKIYRFSISCVLNPDVNITVKMPVEQNGVVR
jgi:Tfp pilus assembly protein PilN